MQLTASKPAVYAWSVCRRERMLRGMHRGLAAADLWLVRFHVPARAIVIAALLVGTFVAIAVFGSRVGREAHCDRELTQPYQRLLDRMQQLADAERLSSFGPSSPMHAAQ
jgi:hypothetical protein